MLRRRRNCDIVCESDGTEHEETDETGDDGEDEDENEEVEDDDDDDAERGGRGRRRRGLRRVSMQLINYIRVYSHIRMNDDVINR